jgi:hypothetical protein
MGASETLNGWKDSQQAFEEAIAAGRLSADPQHPRYAGHYMYMGPYDGRGGDAFKHSMTRLYLPREA